MFELIELMILAQIEETLEKADLQLHTELWYTESGTTTAAVEVNGSGSGSDKDQVKNENGESPPQEQHHNPSWVYR